MQSVRVLVHIADGELSRRVQAALVECRFAVHQTELAEAGASLAAVSDGVLLLEAYPAAVAWLRGADAGERARTLLLGRDGQAPDLEWRAGIASMSELDLLPELLLELARGMAPEADSEAAADKVLMVDDDAAMRCDLTAGLEAHGFACRGAADGTEALRVLSEWAPGVILLDLDMPGMDGLHFLERARETQPRPFGVIVLTGMSSEALREQVSRYGALALLEKPVDFARLLQLIGMQGDFRKTQRSLRRRQALYPSA